MDWYKIYEEARLKQGDKIEIVNDTEVLACWLFDISEKLRESSKKVLEIQDSIKSKQREMQLIEDRILVNVSTDEEDKKKFTNQNVRDAEVRIRAGKHTKWTIHNGALDNMRIDFSNAKSDVEYYSTMFKAVKDEIYHRRRVEELDSMRDMQKTKIESFKTDN